MAVVQAYVFGLLFCFIGYFHKDVYATDRITNLENKFEILDQKFTLQTLELSQVKQELAVEKTSRMLLEIRLDSLIYSSDNNKIPFERVRDKPNITASTQTNETVQAKTDELDNDRMNQLFKDVAVLNNVTIDVLNEIDILREVQNNLSERLVKVIGEIKEKLEIQDIQLNQTIYTAKTDKEEMQTNLHDQQIEIEFLKLESINTKKNSDIFNATVSILVKGQKQINETIQANIDEVSTGSIKQLFKDVGQDIQPNQPINIAKTGKAKMHVSLQDLQREMELLKSL